MTQYVDGSLYYYAPNKVAPIVFSVLFCLSGLLHFYQTWRYRLWTTTGLMPWAALLLTAGFALREVGAYHYSNVDILIANTVLIMSGP
jgi:membrane protein DedA with SNARE-associated domain